MKTSDNIHAQVLVDKLKLCVEIQEKVDKRKEKKKLDKNKEHNCFPRVINIKVH